MTRQPAGRRAGWPGRRLAPRLVLAMLAVMVLSVTVVVVTQWAMFYRARAALPSSVQFRLAEVRRLDAHEGVWRVLVQPPVSEGTAATRSSVTPPDRPEEWPSVQDAVRGIRRVQDAQWAGITAGLGVAAVLSTLLALRLARTIARPVEAVGAAATRLAHGELGSRVVLPANPLGASAELDDLARDFNAMAESLERAEAQRTTMIADVAHELRTPLTAMSLRLDALRDGLAPLDLSEVERLQRQACLLARLVEDLRTLSLADAGRLTLDRGPVDLVALSAVVADAHAPTAEAKAITVRVRRVGDAGEGDGTVVLGDRDRLSQVLGNLLDNAIRVAPAGGEVVIEVERDGDAVVWRVRDDGPGIAAGDLPHLFERFRQGAGGRRDTRGSSGLGLAIVRTLVDLHGGDVAAASPPGGGATFVVRIAAAPQA